MKNEAVQKAPRFFVKLTTFCRSDVKTSKFRLEREYVERVLQFRKDKEKMEAFFGEIDGESNDIQELLNSLAVMLNDNEDNSHIEQSVRDCLSGKVGQFWVDGEELAAGIGTTKAGAVLAWSEIRDEDSSGWEED